MCLRRLSRDEGAPNAHGRPRGSGGLLSIAGANCYSRKKSLNDLLPLTGSRIWVARKRLNGTASEPVKNGDTLSALAASRQSAKDRKSTRLNSSHLGISYAVFCLKKKRNTRN